GPLRSLVSVETFATLSRPLVHHPAAPFIVAATYFCSVFVVFPRAALTLPAVLVFGPWLTFFSGMTGLLIGAVCGFWIGQKLTAEKLQSLTGSPLLQRVEQKLRLGGVGAVVVVRLVPVAPFTVVNMIFGVLRIRMGDFVLGTFLGLLPGFVFSVFVGDRVRIMARGLDSGDLLVLAIQVIGAGVVLFLLWRMASAKFKEKER
ncbi:MAG: TVP38/TMEM64 family protein, partial [Candidatus Binatia bacterium]